VPDSMYNAGEGVASEGLAENCGALPIDVAGAYCVPGTFNVAAYFNESVLVEYCSLPAAAALPPLVGVAGNGGGVGNGLSVCVSAIIGTHCIYKACHSPGNDCVTETLPSICPARVVPPPFVFTTVSRCGCGRMDDVLCPGCVSSSPMSIE
jgi:hypothetical protein